MKLKTAALAVIALALSACGEKEPSSGTESGATPAAEAKGPALWRTGDADTTVYLFGTVHVLPPDLEWRTPAIDAAMAEAETVYFETDVEPDLSELEQAIRQLGMYQPPERLSDNLQPDDRAALAAAARDLGVPMAALDSMRPWLAAVTLSEQLIARVGYDVGSGVERRLAPEAAAAGKEIRKFESVREQLLAFADLPEEVQISFLMEGVRQIDRESKILDDLVNAWAKGNVGRLDEIMIEQDLAKTPDIYAALLVNRNANWTRQLDQLIQSEPGAFFVAVGAAHLIGKDSVIAKLEPLGYAVERLE